MEKEYPFIKQIMPLPDNVEAEFREYDMSTRKYTDDWNKWEGWVVLFALVEEQGLDGKIFTAVEFYTISPDGDGEITDDCTVRLVPKSQRKGEKS